MIRRKTKDLLLHCTEAKPKRGYKHAKGHFWVFLLQSTIDTGLTSVAEDKG